MDDQLNSPTPSTAWMVVYIASSEPEAYVIAGRLKNEGIDSFVHQEPVGRVYGLSIGPLGEVKVMVRPDQYDQALTILDDDEFISDETDIVPEDGDE